MSSNNCILLASLEKVFLFHCKSHILPFLPPLLNSTIHLSELANISCSKTLTYPKVILENAKNLNDSVILWKWQCTIPSFKVILFFCHPETCSSYLWVHLLVDKITKWLRLEGTSGDGLVQHTAQRRVRDRVNWSDPSSIKFWVTPKMETPKLPLVIYFKCVSFCSYSRSLSQWKSLFLMFKWKFMYFSLPLVMSWGTAERNLALWH